MQVIAPDGPDSRFSRRVYPEKQLDFRPYADEDDIALPALFRPYADDRAHSSIVLAGPEQVSAAEIAANAQERAAHHAAANAMNRSSVGQLVRQDLPWVPSTLSGQKRTSGASDVDVAWRRALRTPPRAARSTLVLTDEPAIGFSDDVKTRRVYGRNMRSDVDRIVFGRDFDGSEEIEGEGGHMSEAAPRGKGGGVFRRNMRSDVDSIVFGRDLDGSDAFEQAPVRGEGRRHMAAGHASNVMEHLTWGEADAADEAASAHRGGGGGGAHSGGYSGALDTSAALEASLERLRGRTLEASFSEPQLPFRRPAPPPSQRPSQLPPAAVASPTLRREASVGGLVPGWRLMQEPLYTAHVDQRAVPTSSYDMRYEEPPPGGLRHPMLWRPDWLGGSVRRG